uniref:Reverse transcriptase domain-containing protein n=1 Tax=Gasterosteus aculeatus aculeatus TaxID=481459 RepID=A0AAQ4RMD0_GASAC
MAVPRRIFYFWGGDFNCTENDLKDRNHAEPHPASQRVLRQLVQSYGLVDVWRRMHADCRQYTWSLFKEGRISSARLDRFYVFKQHFNIFKMCSIVPAVFTDHSLLLCNVFIGNVLPRSAYWHFNSVLTCDQNFREVFVYFWGVFRLRKSEFSSLKQWWDHGKIEIGLLCQQHTFNVTRDIARSMKDLETEIVELEHLSESTGDRGHFEVLKGKKMALADLFNVKVQGALVRSRFQTITEMDTPSSFFFGLEKKSGQGRVIHSLLGDVGQPVVEPCQIRRRAVAFFSSLYTSEYGEEEALMEELCSELPQVQEETNAMLDRPISPGELRAALMGMQGGRAPGIDGLSAEFYKAFWDILADDILEVLNDSLASGSMPMSCRRAVITLLPKKGNPQDIGNWRPVSLLCVDYKLLSKVFASRLREAMEQVIHRDQTYCVPGRSMVDNVYLIRDVLEVSSSLGNNTGLISLDQEKAFDRVEHNFLWKVMQSFGFSAGFIAKIKVLYRDIESVLKINGSLCAPFRVYRGVRQGCALSGMLYTLSLEPLLGKIRSSLEGLVLPGFSRRMILSAYADDVVVFIKDQRDADLLNNIVKRFSKASAARVNWKKSEALAVGEWRGGLPVLPQSLVWRKDGFKYLGIYLGQESIVQKNWEGVTEKIEGKLSKWKWLLPQMSFKGRVLVLNNLIASQLWHRLTCLDPPSGFLANLQKKMVDFFWGGLHWVPQGVLFLPREEGGQGLVHLASRTTTFRLQFLQKYLTGPEFLVWRDVASCIFRRANNLGMDTALFLIDSKFLKLNGLPPFYQGVFKSWALFNHKRCPQSFSLYWLLREPLIYRARLDISSSGTPGLMGALLKARVLCLQQLVDAVGPTLSDAPALGSLLGLHSVRMARRLLELWNQRLTEEERSHLTDYSQKEVEPDPANPFPEIYLSPGLGELTGPLLATTRPEALTLHEADKKTLYFNCVKGINRSGLCDGLPTVWSNRLGQNGPGPQWRILYKPPLKKRTADLQWRILHGAVASNAFISVINPTVLSKCPFCDLRETIYHVFTECKRLTSFFSLLTSVFSLFNVVFTEKIFIMGAAYKK